MNQDYIKLFIIFWSKNGKWANSEETMQELQTQGQCSKLWGTPNSLFTWESITLLKT